MARLIGPDEASREVKAIVGRGFQNKVGRPAQLWADAAATTPADVLTEAGAVISQQQPAGNGGRGMAPTVTIDSSSMLPLVQYPPGGVDVIYGTCDGGPAWPMYARTDDRIDRIGAGPVSGITYDSQGRLGGYTEAGGVWSAITYDAAGRVTSYTVNGTAHTVSYNAAGQITGVS